MGIFGDFGRVIWEVCDVILPLYKKLISWLIIEFNLFYYEYNYIITRGVYS